MVLLSSICIVYSLEDKNKTALTVKTTDPLSLSIMCSEIDSITFSNVDLNGVVHDSIVTQLIHTPDTILVFPIDSIFDVSFTNQSIHAEIINNYNDLSTYLNDIEATQMDSATVVSKILTWLNEQDNVVSAALMENNSGIEVTYSQGGTGHITFEHLEEIYDLDEPVFSPERDNASLLTRSSEPLYHDITAIKDEEILKNTKFLYFRGFDDPLLWSANGSLVFEEAIKQSPISNSIITPKVSNLEGLISGLKESSVAIITQTHGEPTFGSFMVNYSPYYLKLYGEDLLQPDLKVYFKDKIFEFSVRIAWVKPKFFDKFETGEGVGVLSYCWSDAMRTYLDSKVNESSNAIKHKSFASQETKTYAPGNRLRAREYLYNLCRGYTHAEAVKNSNKQIATVSPDQGNDGQLFKEVECKPKRFFSIENIDSFTKYGPEYAMVYCMIKGWTNLKHDEIKNFKIWYKDEKFEHPDETCKVHEFEVKPGNVFTSKLLNDTLKFTDDGPNVIVFNVLQGDNGIHTYYTLGFEYNDEIYHGKVDSLTCIAQGVTEGDWIDMGLPSGTIWASKNYKEAYNIDIDEFIELNLPTKAQFEELFSDDNTYKVQLNRQWIRLVSKHNGNRINFPFYASPTTKYVMNGIKYVSDRKDYYYNLFWRSDFGFPDIHLLLYKDAKFGFIENAKVDYWNYHCVRLVK